METGAITGYIDVAQLVLYVFWIFFAGLIYYLAARTSARAIRWRRTNGRERDVRASRRSRAQDLHMLAHGGEATVPEHDARRDRCSGRAGIALWPARRWCPPATRCSTASGPGAYAERADVPDTDFEAHAKIVPLRVADRLRRRAARPRSARHDGRSAPTARSAAPWSTCGSTSSEAIVPLPRGRGRRAGGKRHVLLPMNFARDPAPRRRQGARDPRRPVRRRAGHARARPGDHARGGKIMAYYGAGTLYAEPSRQEPLLMKSATHGTGHEHEIEPQPGLPEPLPRRRTAALAGRARLARAGAPRLPRAQAGGLFRAC